VQRSLIDEHTESEDEATKMGVMLKRGSEKYAADVDRVRVLMREAEGKERTRGEERKMFLGVCTGEVEGMKEIWGRQRRGQHSLACISRRWRRGRMCYRRNLNS
jgi:hypothetical protein